MSSYFKSLGKLFSSLALRSPAPSDAMAPQSNANARPSQSTPDESVYESAFEDADGDVVMEEVSGPDLSKGLGSFNLLCPEIQTLIWEHIPLREDRPLRKNRGEDAQGNWHYSDKSFAFWPVHPLYEKLSSVGPTFKVQFDALVFSKYSLVIDVTPDSTSITLQKGGTKDAKRYPFVVQNRVLTEYRHHEEYCKSWVEKAADLPLECFNKIIVRPLLLPNVGLDYRVACLRKGLKCLDSWLSKALDKHLVQKAVEIDLQSHSHDNLLLNFTKSDLQARFPTDLDEDMSWCGLFSLCLFTLSNTLQRAPVKIFGATSSLRADLFDNGWIKAGLEAQDDYDETMRVDSILVKSTNGHLFEMDQRSHFHIAYAVFHANAFRDDLNSFINPGWKVSREDWTFWTRWDVGPDEPGADRKMCLSKIRANAPVHCVSLFIYLHKFLFIAYCVLLNEVDRNKFAEELRNANGGSTAVSTSTQGVPVVPEPYKTVLDKHIKCTTTMTKFVKEHKKEWHAASIKHHV